MISERTFYLLRHAHAGQATSSPDDGARRLTRKGQQQSLRVAQFLRAQAITIGQIYTSPLVRTAQTAHILHQNLGLAQPAKLDALRIYTPAAEQVQALHDLLDAGVNHALLVGHEPDLSQLLALLLGGSAAHYKVRKSTLIALQFEKNVRGTWQAQLRFLLPCDLLPKAAED